MAAVQQAPLFVQYEREEMMYDDDDYEDLGELSGKSLTHQHTPMTLA